MVSGHRTAQAFTFLVLAAASLSIVVFASAPE
jgi:hypothetical protein